MNFKFNSPNFPLKKFTSSLEWDGKKFDLNWELNSKKYFTAKFPFGKLTLRQNFDNNSATFYFSLHLKKCLHELKINFIEFTELKADHLLTQGLSMGNCHAWKFPQSKSGGELKSFYLTIFRKNDEFLKISTPLMQKNPIEFTGKIKKSGVKDCRISTIINHMTMRDFEFEPITFELTKEIFSSMQTYGSANIECPKTVENNIKYGWNSWDYYRWTITETEVLANAEFIAADPVLSKYIKRIIVDDGWQYCYGEWDGNSLFPSGMENLAKKITKMGFEPGLWFAPAIAEPHSRIAQLHPEMLGMAHSGMPCLSFDCMRRKGFVLDPTVKTTQDFLEKLFSRYAGMGYKYFKLDFLQALLGAKRFHDGEVGRGELVKKLLEPIHRGINGRSEILGCNYPYCSGNKYVNAMRTGADIHARYNSLKDNTLSIVSRFYMPDEFTLVDPDFALCRSFDTANDPAMIKLAPALVYVSPEEKNAELGKFELVHEINAPQIEILLSLVLMVAGAVNLSDNLLKLNRKGLELARKVVSAPRLNHAIPLDLFENELPEQYLQTSKNLSRILLINWHDDIKTFEFDLNAHDLRPKKIVNFWDSGEVKIAMNRITAEIPPRSCKLFELL